jgi:hypothetical protein
MSHTTIYTILWVFWIVAFLALEIPALLDRRLGDTLSEHVWIWFKVKDVRPTAFTWVMRLTLVAFMVWLSGHFIFGIWSL